jgi:hypothetical protein
MWVTLSVHEDDTSINGEFQSFTWKLQGEEEIEGFRFFRIVNTGLNKLIDNAEWGSVLVAGAFDLYGTLCIDQTKVKKEEVVEEVIVSRKFDESSI